ncbi:MAG: hypothetical protein IJW18_08880 [Lachnospiraceae bacterium]|nr:hypothetical protein [Lachnospiraceae bacterium]
MTLTIIIAVLLLAVESSRWACARTFFEWATEYSVKSVLADYYVPLYEEYGVMFLDETYGGERGIAEEKFKEYLTYNINPNRGRLVADTYFYDAYLSDKGFEEIVYAAYADGEPLRRQACEYMKYRLPADVIHGLIEQSGFMDEAEAVKDFFDEIQAISGSLAEVDSAIKDISNCMDEIEACQIKLSESLTKVKDSYGKEEKEQTKAEKILEEDKLSLYASVSNLKNNINGYYEVTSGIEEYLKEVEAGWIGNDEISAEIKQIITDEVGDILLSCGSEGDIFGIEQVDEATSDFAELLYKSVEDEDFDEQQLASYEMPDMTFPEEVWDSADTDIMMLFEELVNGGLYYIICPEYMSISTTPIEQFHNRYRAEQDSDELKLSGLYMKEEALDNLYFAMYVTSMFGDYCNPCEEHEIVCETEYVIGGKENERLNIQAVINELISVRTMLNLLYLMGDGEKKAKAHDMAVKLVGATGMYVMIKVVQYFILLLWALGEAVIDARILMDGGSVAFLKEAKDWKLETLSMDDILSAATSYEGDEQNADINDLYYKDYLNIILIRQRKGKQAYRVMDLIEENIQNTYYSEFYFENCIYAIKAKASFSLNSLFELNTYTPDKADVSYYFSY